MGGRTGWEAWTGASNAACRCRKWVKRATSKSAIPARTASTMPGTRRPVPPPMPGPGRVPGRTGRGEVGSIGSGVALGRASRHPHLPWRVVPSSTTRVPVRTSPSTHPLPRISKQPVTWKVPSTRPVTTRRRARMVPRTRLHLRNEDGHQRYESRRESCHHLEP